MSFEQSKDISDNIYVGIKVELDSQYLRHLSLA